MSSAYKDLGVSAKKEAVHAATKNNDKGLFPNAFCKISPMPFGVAPEYVRIAHADGAGTKTALAYMYWKETGDMTVWHGVVQDSIVMNLDDVTCVGGVLGHFSLTSSINRNPFNIPDEVLAALIEGEKIFLSKMQKHGIRMDGQCGETADVPDLTPTLVIDNTLECIMRKEDVIDNGNIGTGDLIVGLASHGRAIYEDSYNGGMRSNGLTLARHGVLSQEYRAKYPETFYAKLGEKAYRGSKKLTDLITVDGGEQVPVGKLVLSPTRTYAPIVKEILYGGTQGISGIVHNSGGGMTKCLNYIGPGLAATKYDLFPT
ncbi:MAG: phosphoribosylformylglycinamidine cyclo-ligase, partial [Alphaproteobacteria bacterium]|nr:phosphoribosylformylglycinamidine cyclo-ligase [Alphaproteobacteria bacterium]